jgi:hypothetical protein
MHLQILRRSAGVASTLTRRPLPALVSLLALLLLTGLVWWRVLHRDDAGGAASSAACPTPTKTVAATLPAPAKVTVTVLNATTRAGIAAKARTTLVTEGFQVPTLAANDRPHVRVRGVAEIRYGPTGAKGAQLLNFYFPGAKLVQNTGKTAVVVVSLGDKYKRIPTPAAVRAALVRQHIELASPTPTPSGSPSC